MIDHPRIRFVADDLGWDSSANQAILHSHLHGALTSAALMMGQPGTDEAVTLAKQYPSLEIGLHFHFCDSTPLTLTRWPWGSDPSSLGLRLGFQKGSTALVRKEMRAQWRLLKESGLTPAFVNVHHHLHSHPWIAQELASLLKEEGFNGWIRLGLPRFFSEKQSWKSHLLSPGVALYQKGFKLSSPQTLWGIDRTFEMNPEETDRVIQTLTEGTHEFIFHPRERNDCDTLCLIQLKTLGY
jgi:predicted glycoside hydrolase/deacetylase ChbG (UPF0249 family)